MEQKWEGPWTGWHCYSTVLKQDDHLLDEGNSSDCLPALIPVKIRPIGYSEKYRKLPTRQLLR